MSFAEIERVLALAARMQRSRSDALLRGRKVVLLFYEASTRTRVSFELAAKALGATTTLVTSNASSIEKGESLVDTGLTLEALGADAIVMRHPSSGAPFLLADNLSIPIINAGDGMHEHPTQALLDAYTILQHRPALKGLRVTIVGDILHSRVARSNVHLLSRFGAHVTLCGPPDLLPVDLLVPSSGRGVAWPEVTATHDMHVALAGADVVMLLRVQKERLAGMTISPEEYIARYQMTNKRLRLARPDALLMHPGPIVRGMELSGELAGSPQSVLLQQVRNGVAVRMAVLARALSRQSSRSST